MTPAAAGTKSKWNLYSWNETDGNIFRPFVTTEDPKAFVLENFEMPAEGYSFAITTPEWSPVYGNNWAESIQTPGYDYALTTQEQVNTWLALPEGKYRLTFTLTATGATLKAEAAPEALDVNSILGDPDTPARYYTLQGIEVDQATLSPGLYIMATAHTPTRKVIVK